VTQQNSNDFEKYRTPQDSRMNKVHRHNTVTIALATICLAAAGCTTTRTLPVPRAATQAQTSSIKPGSKIIVTLRSGETRNFRVTAVEPDALVGKDTRIPFADIEKLQEKIVNSGRTVGAVVGGTLLVLGGAFALYVHEVAKNDE
jgi:hypothetical protein